MAARPVERKLAAIFAADVAGYSRLMAADEAGTVARLKSCRAIIDGLIGRHRGRIFNTAGDSVVADFASAVDAVECAVAVQGALAEIEEMRFRIGIHAGDVIIDGANLLGDAVNIAARLEALAEPGGIFVSSAVRDQVGGRLPVEFADLGEHRLKNIAAPLRAYAVGPRHAGAEGPAAERTAGEARPLPLPDKPSIAVLPFQNMSDDPEQEYFADGMVEEIITALSRIRWLFVIARNSSFTYKGEAVDVKRVGRELGVRYVLEGSVRKGGNRVRITTQLIEAATGAHLWADRFDGALDDVFELQDKVALNIAGIIEPTLQAAETRHSASRPTGNPSAYDLYLRALAQIATYGREQRLAALAVIEQAIDREPDYAPALALAAACRVDLENYDWSDDSAEQENREAAIALARRALRCDPDDPGVLGRAALALGRFGEDIQGALALMDRALMLNPSFAAAWYWSGWLRLFAGDAAAAIEHFETSMRLNPRSQRGFHLSGIGMAHLVERRFEEAVAVLRVSLEELPNFTPTYRSLAAALGHLGRLDEARALLSRLAALTPVVIPGADPMRNPEHGQVIAAGLRLAAEGKAAG